MAALEAFIICRLHSAQNRGTGLGTPAGPWGQWPLCLTHQEDAPGNQVSTLEQAVGMGEAVYLALLKESLQKV